MLPKHKKIPRKLFNDILTRGKIFHSPNITLRIRKNDSNNTVFSFVVSKKVAKKSVERNKLKRQGYSIIKEFLDKIKGSYSYIFFLKKGIIGMKYKDIKNEIYSILDKAGFIV